MALILTRKVRERITISHEDPEMAAILGSIIIEVVETCGHGQNGRAKIAIDANRDFRISRTAPMGESDGAAPAVIKEPITR